MVHGRADPPRPPSYRGGGGVCRGSAQHASNVLARVFMAAGTEVYLGASFTAWGGAVSLPGMVRISLD